MASPEDYMCPNCVTPWKCNGPHIPAPLCGNDEWDSRYACVKPKGHPTNGPGLTDHDYRVKRATPPVEFEDYVGPPDPLDVLTRAELVEALRGELHIDPEHGFPEGFGPEQLADNLFDAIRSRGGHHAKTQTS